MRLRKNLRRALQIGFATLLLWAMFWFDAPPQRIRAEGLPGNVAQQGGNRYVSTTGVDAGECSDLSAPCKTIQYAIDRANPDDSVLAAGGVYTDVNQYAGLAQVAYISESLQLRGGYSLDFSEWNADLYPTTLNAQGNGRGIFVAGSIDVTLEGLGITNGNAEGLLGDAGTPGRDFGGGIYVITSTVTVRNCILTGNTSDDGGGIFVVNSPEARIQSSRIAQNQASWSSGGLLIASSKAILEQNEVVANASQNVGGLVVLSSDLTLTNNTISGNSDTRAEVGGLWVCAGTAQMMQNSVSDNLDAGILISGLAEVTATQNTISRNGNVGVMLYNTGRIILNDNLISQNASTGNGGGVSIVIASNVAMAGNSILENNTPGSGGGVHVYGSGTELDLSGNEIAGNQAGQSGGGVHFSGMSSASTFEAANNQIHNNIAGQHGGGMYVDDGIEDIIDIEHNLIGGNIAYQSGAGLYLDGQSISVNGHAYHHSNADDDCRGSRNAAPPNRYRYRDQ